MINADIYEVLSVDGSVNSRVSPGGTSRIRVEEALEKVEKHKGKIDLITTELDMPIIDGYAMLYELKQKGNMPLVVFISEDTTKGVMQDLISMGAKDFILKPVNRRLILERVKNVLTRYSS